MYLIARLSVAALFAAAISGCGGTGTTDSNQIGGMVLNADGDTALVARNTGFVGSAVKVSVVLDGQKVASLGNNEVGSFRASPGKHTVGLDFEGVELFVKTNTITYDNDPDRPQYFVITLKKAVGGSTFSIAEVSESSFASFLN